MLTPDERTRLEIEILSENKKTMKEILVLAEFCLPTDKFESFRHSIFNRFGVSGLESIIKNKLDKYTSKEVSDGK